MRRQIWFAAALTLFVSATAKGQCAIHPGLYNWWGLLSPSATPTAASDFTLDKAGAPNRGLEEGSPTRMSFGIPKYKYHALCFPKPTDSMVVPNHPDVDIGDEDFTIKGVFSLFPTTVPESISNTIRTSEPR